MKVKQVLALCFLLVFVVCSCNHSFVPYKGYVIDVDSAEATVILLDNNELWGWGYNQLYGLGYVDESVYVNKTIRLADDVTSFSAGGATTLFIKPDNSLWGLGMLDLSITAPSQCYTNGIAI